MRELRNSTDKMTLNELGKNIKALMKRENFEAGKQLLCDAMAKYPDAAEPHNLLGIIMEKQGNHTGAMKHFRAAWALDPTYCPARTNLERYGAYEMNAKPAFY